MNYECIRNYKHVQTSQIMQGFLTILNYCYNISEIKFKKYVKMVKMCE